MKIKSSALPRARAERHDPRGLEMQQQLHLLLLRLRLRLRLRLPLPLIFTPL
ncbi:hypothetical protein [Rhodanobacter sp. Root627]|uniref:hypothetical protein n=1 Tax=Rhodanobacter sp. Root627 TaxID=1736572 RepID=UPI000AF84536|nr:hypothetical protein [Rhodanobacter sp. Root627]